jgi:hypothetical protein
VTSKANASLFHLDRRTFVTAGAATIAMRYPLLASIGEPVGVVRPLDFEQIKAGGDLAIRADMSFQRLQGDIYRSPQIFKGAEAEWPGDWEGRILLGLTLLSRATGTTAPSLAKMIQDYPRHMNEFGYFGKALDTNSINEQQLSGHGWVLRGLCELYEWKHDPAVLHMIRAIVDNLALPTRGAYRNYPIEPSHRVTRGGVIGNLDASQSGWMLSSDIGCAFIFLDGVTHAWTILRTRELKDLIDEMIERFLQLDLIVVKAQTHASLTSMRALLRVYEQSQDSRLLFAVEERYALYRTLAMNEHFANYNWFDRPDSWTEPCAIIDSFIVATQLWRFTMNPHYLEDAHLIWFNGIGRGQRPNGGYGTDSCSGVANPFLKILVYEATWCCTMRGGEGHARSIQYSYFTRPGEVFIPFFNDSTAHLEVGGEHLALRQTTEYPYRGHVRLEVLSTTLKSPIAFRFLAAEWMAHQRINLNGQAIRPLIKDGFASSHILPKPGDIVEYNCSLIVRAHGTRNPHSILNYYSFRAGPLMLVHLGGDEIRLPRNSPLSPEAQGTYRVPGTELRLSRINDVNSLDLPQKDPCLRQLLFRQA